MTIQIPNNAQPISDKNGIVTTSWFTYLQGLAKIAISGSGTVTNFSFNDANGFTGSVTNSTTTPELTLNLDEVDGGTP